MSANKEKITKRDMVWIIFILVLVILALCLLIISNSKTASSVLSVVSTGISMVLSLVAIIYTFISGIQSSNLNSETQTQIMQLEKQVSSLNDSIRRKIQLQEDMDKYLENVRPFVQEIADTTNGTITVDETIREKAIKMSERIRKDFEDDE